MESDREAISAIHVRSWQWAYRGLLPDSALDTLTVEERRPIWQAALGPGTSHRIWLAERAAEVPGFAAWGPPRDPDATSETAELCAIYLDPSAAGSGVARQLLGAVAVQGARRMVALRGTELEAVRYQTALGGPDGLP